MSYYKKNLSEVQPEKGSNTFEEVLSKIGSNVVRDTWMLLRESDSESQKIQVGYTVVYPGCSTRGHQHPPLEEVYFVLSGQGIMEIDQDRFEIKAGDVVYIPFGKFHRAENPHSHALSYVWVTVKKEG
ncbi:dimethylsulfonioproprionate lyase family protein [Thermatribacter velox]|uniref:Dimethylsulfonioproprionate lyase family protein n=1 Tax=Thermatribacter velox TaxID=3039681 RepID=A0ABZ2YCQ9_9BACT